MDNKLERLEELFWQASQLESEAERSAFLDEACGANLQLREKVDRLLKNRTVADEMAEAFQPTLALARSDMTDCIIGPYKLREKIGEGGMGVVYAADQKSPVKRRVALKVIKPGMGSRLVIARFESERQTLALMDHPNIARVLDAGTTEQGLPYFVMELVNGVPITRYCDEHRLTIRQRLELMIPICRAVQHAHQKGIIHRDLKPSNILVAQYDEKPVPKVIDFGVAKAVGSQLGDYSVYTEFGTLVGTLEYMSPEQARRNQLDIDTRSDVYSLGVVLYELLSGATPFDGKRLRSAAFEEMLRIIRDEDPLRPSQKLSTSGTLPSIASSRSVTPDKLSKSVRGELDWIVMKALEKDRARRYPSCSEFAQDLGHYLLGEAVLASPPSARYRLMKTLRRHRVACFWSAALGLAILGGLVVSIFFAVEATRARRGLEQQQAATIAAKQSAERVSELLIRTFESPSREADGREILAVDLLDENAPLLLGENTLDPLTKADLSLALGRTYDALGLEDQAQPLVGQALEIYENQKGAAARETLKARARLATFLCETERVHEGLELLRVTAQAQESQFGRLDPDTSETRSWLAWRLTLHGYPDEGRQLAENLVADCRMLSGDDQEKLISSLILLAKVYAQLQLGDLARQRLEEADALLSEDGPRFLDFKISIWNSFGDLSFSAQDWQESVSFFRDAFDTCKAKLGPTHPRTFKIGSNLAFALYATGAKDEGLNLARECVDKLVAKLGPDDRRTLLAKRDLGYLLSTAGERETGQAMLEDALDGLSSKFGPNDPETLACKAMLAVSLVAPADRERGFELLNEAYQAYSLEDRRRTTYGLFCVKSLVEQLLGEGRFDEVVAIVTPLLPLESQGTTVHIRTEVFRILNGYAQALQRLGKTDDALAQFQSLADQSAATIGKTHELSIAHRANAAMALADLGRREEALPLLEQARSDLAEFHPEEAQSLWAVMNNIARVRGGLGQHREALEVLLELYRSSSGKIGELERIPITVANNVGMEYYALGQFDDALEWFQRAIEGGSKTFGAEHPATLNYRLNAFNCLVKGDQLDDALAVLPETRSAFASQPSQLASLLAALGQELLKAKRYEAARGVLEECEAIRREVLPDHWLYFNVKSMLGEALMETGHLEDAEPLLKSGFEGLLERRDTISGTGLDNLPLAATRLIRFYTQLGRDTDREQIESQLQTLN